MTRMWKILKYIEVIMLMRTNQVPKGSFLLNVGFPGKTGTQPLKGFNNHCLFPCTLVVNIQVYDFEKLTVL